MFLCNSTRLLSPVFENTQNNNQNNAQFHFAENMVCFRKKIFYLNSDRYFPPLGLNRNWKVRERESKTYRFFSR